MSHKVPKPLTPRLPFLLRRRTVVFILPAALVCVAARLLQSWNVYFGVVWVALAAVISIPTVFVARTVHWFWRSKRRAAKLGAVIPPTWEGKKWGNMDVVNYCIEKFNTGYPDTDVIKTILATDFQHWEKGEGFRETLEPVLGNGVFNADGEMWKFHRTMTRPYFSRDKISHFEMFGRHADLTIRKMKERFRGGHALDFQDLIGRFTLDSATEFLFGQCVHSLESDLPYAHNDRIAAQTVHVPNAADRFVEAFSKAQQVISKRLREGGVAQLLGFTKDALKEHMEVVDAYLKPILDEAVRKNRKLVRKDEKSETGSEPEDEENETLLDHLVKRTDDPELLHDETLNILIAGRDTTAATLTFAVYLLCMNPNVLQRLRVEILEKIGSHQMPTFDDIRQLKYLRAVINETLRLYPVVPFNVRFANEDTTIPNPDPTAPRVFVPKNIGVAYSVFAMHRRKDYWGPDALSFDPDRFIDERLNKYFTANPFIFLPFNAGPRICLGQQFAYNEMSFFLIRLLQNFSHMELDLSAQPPDARPPQEWAGAEGQKGIEKIVPRAHLTLYVHGGLWVKMTEAEQEA